MGNAPESTGVIYQRYHRDFRQYIIKKKRIQAISVMRGYGKKLAYIPNL
jgi:hypothetical protein